MLTKGTVGYIIVKTFIKILQCRIKKLDAIATTVMFKFRYSQLLPE
jgi:hypothetical protein